MPAKPAGKPRPWDRVQSIPEKTAPATLVPTSRIGAPTQRLLAASVFFLLQGFKLASPKTTGRFVGFSVLDAVFLLALPVFGIPRLRFKSRVVKIQLVMAVVANYTIFVDARWFFWLLWLVLQPVAWILRPKSTPDAYIRGKYTVDILPEALAKLDTIAPLCVERRPEQPVYMRLAFENTWPSAVSLSRAELGNTAQYETLKFSGRQLSSFPTEDGKLYIPVTKPGAYYLDRITDEETGLRVKIVRERVVIPPCPQVKLAALNGPVCSGTNFSAEVTAEGVAPLTVNVDGLAVKLGEAASEDAVQTLRYVVTKPAVSSHTGGQVGVTIASVEDALGTQPKHSVRDEVKADVIPLPSVRFSSQGPLAKVGKNVVANIEVSGSPQDRPFRIALRRPDDTDVEVQVANTGTHRLELASVGKYVLTSVVGARCGQPAAVPRKSEIEVFEPPAVDASAQFEVVEDKCAGPMGANARLELAGTAPFRVTYRTKKNGRALGDKVATFAKFTGVIEFRPKDIGSYVYEVVSVEDKYRRHALSDANFEQVLSELPGADLSPVASTTVCGTTLAVDVRVRGAGPFTLNYRLDDGESQSVVTDSSNVCLEQTVDEGRHFVRLDSLTDRRGCVINLGQRTPDVAVFPHVAKLGFTSPGNYKSADPVRLALPLSGEHVRYPVTVVFTHELNGKSTAYTQTLRTAEDTIVATRPGTYRLKELRDTVCGSEVAGDEVSINLYERPRLQMRSCAGSECDADASSSASSASSSASSSMSSSISSSISSSASASVSSGTSNSARDGVCLNTPSKLLLTVDGEAPFTLVHEALDPANLSELRTIESNATDVSIDLASLAAGTYTHYFWLMDRRYPEFDAKHVWEHRHLVRPAGQVAFTKAHALRVCEGVGSVSLPVSVTGDIDIEYEVAGERHVAPHTASGSRSSSSRKLDIDVTKLRRGSNTVRLIGARDTFGCTATVGLSTAHIEVLESPRVPELAKHDYCVGETAVIPLKARGALEVEYSVSGGKRRHETVTSAFEKRVTKPGNLTLLSLKDSQGCRRKTDVGLMFHALPKSTITEEPHFNIYQGDQISLGFAFEGTAPFAFVYTRTVNGKVVERREVTDVMEKTYSMVVDEGGVYEIVELRDKFCQSKR